MMSFLEYIEIIQFWHNTTEVILYSFSGIHHFRVYVMSVCLTTGYVKCLAGEIL